MNGTRISSDTVIDSVDGPFRVLAGPGAGKTYWLTRHVAQVVRRSRRLHGIGRVACISYTNIAADCMERELYKVLGPSASRVSVTTIHAFLYRTVVAPYVGFLRGPTGQPLVPVDRLDGHDVHEPHWQKVDAWLKGAGVPGGFGRFKDEEEQVLGFLRSLRWILRERALALVGGRVSRPRYLPTQQLEAYKHLYWNEGVLDHEDVLYFSFRLLTEFRTIKRFVAATYPYIFVDEFQDTNPLQARILETFAAAGAVVGVVGDRRQSIFQFQGASPEEFENFSPPGVLTYELEDNRRSSLRILKVLNHARADGLRQVGRRLEEGDPVRVLVGRPADALTHVREKWAAAVVTLARLNGVVHELRSSKPGGRRVWEEFSGADPARTRLLEGMTTAVIRARRAQHGHAVEALLRRMRLRDGRLVDPFPSKVAVTEHRRRGVALRIVTALALADGCSVGEAYGLVSTVVQASLGTGLRKLTRGRFAELAAEVQFEDLINASPEAGEWNAIRTVHKAKGDEFDDVLVVLKSEDELAEHVLDVAATGNPGEEENITYVALSRARERLFVTVPTLAPRLEQRLHALKLGIEVVRLDGSVPAPEKNSPQLGLFG